MTQPQHDRELCTLPKIRNDHRIVGSGSKSPSDQRINQMGKWWSISNIPYYHLSTMLAVVPRTLIKGINYISIIEIVAHKRLE